MTDEQAKKWIDTKDVLTKGELVMYVYGSCDRGYFCKGRIKRLWDYVLNTKKWGDLKKYSNHKIITGNTRPDKEQILNLFRTDKRLKQYGSRLGTKILLNVHGIKLTRNIYSIYKREALCLAETQ